MTNRRLRIFPEYCRYVGKKLYFCSVFSLVDVFRNTEPCLKTERLMTMIKNNSLIETAVERLSALIGNWQVRMDETCTQECAALLWIGRHKFRCDVRQVVNSSNILTVIDDCRRRDVQLLIVGNASRTTMERLESEGINVMDANGNCIINIPERLFINIAGIKTDRVTLNDGLNFRSPGITVVFSLLCLERQQIPTIRELASMSGASVGTVKHVLDVLQGNGFVLSREDCRFLKNRNRLLDEWVDLYNRQQRSELVAGRASWIEGSRDWQRLDLPDGMMWGGEPGAFVMNGYMTPEAFCIYSDRPVRDIVATKAIVPNKNGEVVFYRKFWNEDLTERGMALICYADLINQSNSRCMEAARRIRDERLAYSE